MEGKLRLLYIISSLILMYLSLAGDTFALPADELRDFVKAEKDRLGIPGVSIALIDGGVVQYITLGVRRAGESEGVSSNDPFNIGSISKPITAWAVMKLAEERLVSLDAPVRKYLGERWQLPDSEFDNNAVTLRRILSHTAGLSASSYQGFPPDFSPPNLEDSLNGVPLASSAVRVILEPGGKFRYSGGGFAVAQLLIENVTGQSFSEFIASEIFEPLGMQDARYLISDQGDLDVSPHDYSGRPISDYRIIEQGAGGLRASARDLVNFLMANMAPNSVLSEHTVREMHEPVVAIAGDAQHTLGFERRNGLLSHGGHSRGWRAQIDFKPSSRSGLVILTNSADGLRFIQSVRFKWSELFNVGELTEYYERCMLTERVTRWTLAAVSCIALIISMWISWSAYLRIRSGVAQVSVSVKNLVRGLPYVASIGAIWAVLGTELGIYLSEGVSWGFPTINYLPPATVYAATAITVLLATLMCTGFLDTRHP